MTVMFDNNVIIDVITNRENSEASIELFKKAAVDDVNGLICANSLNDIFYVLAKILDPQKAKAAVAKIMQVLYVTPVDVEICSKAINSSMHDFEDAIIAFSASEYDADYIATNDRKFISSDCPVTAAIPAQILETLK